jgi:hypothetical protein
MVRIPLILLILFSIVSCKKAEERSCFKKSGETSKLILNPGEFKRIYLKEHIDYVMVQDTINYLVVEGGKNLIGFIDCSIINNELVISNKNKCNFLRYKTSKITVEIHFKTIENLIFQGTELLTNRNNWNFGQMNIILKDAGGTMMLTNFEGNSLNLINTHGWGDIHLSGNVHYFRADLDGNGYFDALNFSVKDSISVISNSSITSKLNADNCKLKAQLKAIGDVWYVGTPINIWKQELGSGRLIDKN